MGEKGRVRHHLIGFARAGEIDWIGLESPRETRLLKIFKNGFELLLYLTLRSFSEQKIYVWISYHTDHIVKFTIKHSRYVDCIYKNALLSPPFWMTSAIHLLKPHNVSLLSSPIHYVFH